MKSIFILLVTASALWALDEPGYPLHENGEYHCYIKDSTGKVTECQLWLFKRRINDHLMEASKFKRIPKVDGRYIISNHLPIVEYEKESVVLDLNKFAFVKLVRFYRPRGADQPVAESQAK